MRYSDFTQRIAGDGAAAWDIHYRALARVEQGEEILLLSVGDPDFDTPAPIVQSAIDSLLAGNTHYADVRGKRALRQRIAERHRQRSGQAVDAEQVVVLAGAQCALYAVVQCLLNPGDEVIVAEPMYVTYEAVFGACGARVVPVPVRSENGFRVQAEEVAALITPRTRAMALNSPHNPSGASLPRATWEALAELCTAHDLWMISDEVYSELLFDGEHVSPASLPGMAERTATLNSLSKSHAMTGWRVGWVVGPAALCAHLENLALCMLYGSPEFIQDAACTALEAPLPELEAMREAGHHDSETTMNVLIVHAHNEPQSFTRALCDQACETLAGQGHAVQVSDLYAMNWNPVASAADFAERADPDYLVYALEQRESVKRQSLAADIQAELDKLLWADLLILNFPIYWFSVPAILKGWFDRVLVSGVCYGGKRFYDQGGLAGKKALVSLTLGGRQHMFGEGAIHGPLEDMLRPILRGTLAYVGMQVLEPFVAWHVPYISEEARGNFLRAYRARLENLEQDVPLRFPRLEQFDALLQPLAR